MGRRCWRCAVPAGVCGAGGGRGVEGVAGCGELDMRRSAAHAFREGWSAPVTPVPVEGKQDEHSPHHPHLVGALCRQVGVGGAAREGARDQLTLGGNFLRVALLGCGVARFLRSARMCWTASSCVLKHFGLMDFRPFLPFLYENSTRYFRVPTFFS